MKRWLFALLFFGLMTSLAPAPSAAQSEAAFQIAAVKYSGGGDWYQAQTPLPNLLRFVRKETAVAIATEPDVVELTSDKIFTYPVLFLSGHGNVVFSNQEAQRLRRYLQGGGFLYVDDDYGIDEYIRREMKKVFPDKSFVELPFGHPIYQQPFTFRQGPPKVHEHDDNPPQGFGLFVEGRLAVYYTYESNVSDGWESPNVHNNPPEVRREALQMGTNILTYALMN